MTTIQHAYRWDRYDRMENLHCIPKILRMLNGSLLYRSTPAEVTSTKRLMLLGVALMRLPVATESVCSGPFPPFHLQQPEPCCSLSAECAQVYSKLWSSRLHEVCAQQGTTCKSQTLLDEVMVEAYLADGNALVPSTHMTASTPLNTFCTSAASRQSPCTSCKHVVVDCMLYVL